MRSYWLLLSILFVVLALLVLGATKLRHTESYILPTLEGTLVLKQLSEALRHILDRQKTRFAPPLEVLNERNVFEEFTLEEGRRSFTENKKRIVLCLRNNNSFYKWNSLMYVALHEVSHVICDELHHTSKFHAINRALLSHAERLGYYDSSIAFESKYCGM